MTAEKPAKPTPELNLCAYWYSFTFTECEPVDRILHAVARAGKGHHSTEYWADTGDEGEPSFIDRIQDAANTAADAAAATAAERDRFKTANAELTTLLTAALAPFNEPTRNPGGLPIGEPSWCAEARAVLKAHGPDKESTS